MLHLLWPAWLLLQACACSFAFGAHAWWMVWVLRQALLYVLTMLWRRRAHDQRPYATVVACYAALWAQQVLLPILYWHAAVSATRWDRPV
jgi:hypothetical protein